MDPNMTGVGPLPSPSVRPTEWKPNSVRHLGRVGGVDFHASRPRRNISLLRISRALQFGDVTEGVPTNSWAIHNYAAICEPSLFVWLCTCGVHFKLVNVDFGYEVATKVAQIMTLYVDCYCLCIRIVHCNIMYCKISSISTCKKIGVLSSIPYAWLH